MRSSIRKPIVKTNCRLRRQCLGALKSPLLYKSLLAAVAMIFAVPVDSRAEVNEVEAVQQGRSLFIYGDENNNAIRIGQFGNGDIVVQGIECDGRVTDVNGGDELAVFSNVRNIFVKLGDGDDCIAASNDLLLLSDCLDLGEGYLGEPEVFVDLGESIVISGELEIITGQGNDEVYVGGFETGRAMEVYTQAGNDNVGFCDIYVGTNLLVYTSTGQDQVGIVGFEDFVPESSGGPLNYVRYKTLINSGHDNDEVCVESLFNDEGQLKILTYSGNDYVFIGNCNPFTDSEGGKEGESSGLVDVGTNLVLDTGTGNDVAAIGNTLVGTSLIAVLGNGVDDLWIEDASVGRSTIIDTGDQNDDVRINFFETEHDLVIHMRQGVDEASVTNSLVGGNLIATLGAGSDDLYINNINVDRSTIIDTGDQNDDVRINFFETEHDLLIYMREGDDEASVTNSLVGGNLIATLGAGWDDLYIYNIGVSNLTSVNAGSQNDDVFVNGLDADRLQFIMASGDDELYVRNSTGANLYAHGGSGTDCFDEVGNDFTAENVRSFELDCDD